MNAYRLDQQVLLLVLLCVVASGSLLAQNDSLTVADLIGARKFLDEQSILNGIEQQLQQRRSVCLRQQDFTRLEQAGFSKNFRQKLCLLLEKYGIAITERTASTALRPESSGKFHTLVITSQPPEAGTVIIVPPPDTAGRLPVDTEVSLRPQAVAPYLFDHWQGDLRGYQPLKFRLSQDVRAVAVFKQPSKATSPPKIEDPQEFKDTRKAGHVYAGEVVGIVEGRGFNKDWGIAAEVDYKYVYSLEYVSHVLSNDGYQIEEKRTFNSVKEMLIISKYHYHLDIRKDLEGTMQILQLLGEYLYLVGGPQTKVWGKGICIATKLADLTLGAIESRVFSKKHIERAFNSLEKAIGHSRQLQQLKERFLNSDIGKILGYPPHLKYLEGKTVVLRYENGVGLVDVEVESGILTATEKELLQRALYLGDYYIFRDRHDPKKILSPGTTWQVDARTLAGVIDPRLRHKAQGTIALRRLDDQVDNNKHRLAVFSLMQGRIQMVPRIASKKIEGDIALNKGKIFYDLKQQYVVKAQLAGIAKYREISTDHLLFGARLATEPRITINYQCICTEKK